MVKELDLIVRNENEGKFEAVHLEALQDMFKKPTILSVHHARKWTRKIKVSEFGNNTREIISQNTFTYEFDCRPQKGRWNRRLEGLTRIGIYAGDFKSADFRWSDNKISETPLYSKEQLKEFYELTKQIDQGLRRNSRHMNKLKEQDQYQFFRNIFGQIIEEYKYLETEES